MSRKFTPLLVLAGVILSLLAVACGGGTVSGADAEPSDALEITAKSNRFSKQNLVALPNTRVTVAIDNRDRGTLHNIAFYQARNARDLIFRGELFKGIETRTETFTTPGPGSYFFRCDVHPDTMTGTLIVREAGAGASAQ